MATNCFYQVIVRTYLDQAWGPKVGPISSPHRRKTKMISYIVVYYRINYII